MGRRTGWGTGKGVDTHVLSGSPSPRVSMGSPTCKLSETHSLGFFWRPHDEGKIDHILGRW